MAAKIQCRASACGASYFLSRREARREQACRKCGGPIEIQVESRVGALAGAQNGAANGHLNGGAGTGSGSGTRSEGGNRPNFLEMETDPHIAADGQVIDPRDLFVGRYHILKSLNRGGMGEIELALDRKLRRQVVLKRPRLDQTDVLRHLKRFSREARVAASFFHPNFCPIYDYDLTSDPPYIAMAYLEGETLRDFQRRLTHDADHRPLRMLPQRLAAKFTRTLAKAMAVAHRQKILHRDLKPSNVMVNPGGHLIILDFGLARLLDEAEPCLTATGHALGTLSYMAPEQLAGAKREIGRRTDVYSLGVILYELLTNQLPFRGSHVTITTRILQEAPKRPSLIRPDLDPRLEAICLKAMSKKPVDRFASMTAFAEALRQYLETPSEGAGRWSEIARSPRASRTAMAAKVVHESHPPGHERIDNGPIIPMLWCPPGTFRMGSLPSEPERYEDEYTAEVTLTRGFWLGKTPVTQAQWLNVMSGTVRDQSKKAGFNIVSGEGPEHPMYFINYEEATDFCRRLTDLEREAKRLPEGWHYRLPTEAEWEYACRAGTTSATAFGDRLGSDQANFDGNFPYNGAVQGPYKRSTTAVGHYPANPWGFLDMHGNVWEWCRDAYDKRLRGGFDPAGPAAAPSFVNRGGSWLYYGRGCRSAHRGRNTPDVRSYDLGFRIALAPL